MSATIPIALLEAIPLPTEIVPVIAEVVVPVATTPTLASPSATTPTFIAVLPISSRTTPVFFEPVEFILFDTSPFVAPLIYTPIPSVPVIVISSFCTDVITPL